MRKEKRVDQKNDFVDMMVQKAYSEDLKAEPYVPKITTKKEQKVEPYIPKVTTKKEEDLQPYKNSLNIEKIEELTEDLKSNFANKSCKSKK